MDVVQESLTENPQTPSSSSNTCSIALVCLGESEWDENEMFTGWYDAPLSRKSRQQILEVTKLLTDRLDPDGVPWLFYTSRMKRAQTAVNIILENMEKFDLAVHQSWELDPRHYGALTGLSRSEAISMYGEELVQMWLNSIHVSPPPMDTNHQFYDVIHGNPKFTEQLTPDEIPYAESLLSVFKRTLSFWENTISPIIGSVSTSIVIVAPEECIRGLMKHIENKPYVEAMKWNIPIDKPLICSYKNREKGQSIFADHEQLRNCTTPCDLITNWMFAARYGDAEGDDLFTGWHDAPLSEQGKRDALTVSKFLCQENSPMELYTAVLSRAQTAVDLMINEKNKHLVTIHRTWKLNPRHYGALTGLSRYEAICKFSEEQVQIWQNCIDETPPAMESTHKYYNEINQDLRYHGELTPEEFPKAESLRAVFERVALFWENTIVPKMKKCRCIVIVASEDCLRGLIRYLEHKTNREIIQLDLPPDTAICYKFSKFGMKIERMSPNSYESKMCKRMDTTSTYSKFVSKK